MDARDARPRPRVIVAISGASGIVYGIEALRLLREDGRYESHLIVSPSAVRTLHEESDCSLEQIARYAGYSRFRVAHLFKARTGMSIGDYINRTRVRYLDQARVLGLPSKQVAAAMGFQSTTAFYNWRRKASRSETI